MERNIFQKGVLDQGLLARRFCIRGPSDEALIFDIREMKRMGFNMVRKHIKIEPERWYYHCDRLGMIVWQDMVNGGERYHHWFVTYLANVMSWPGLTMKDNHSRLLSRQNQDGRNEFVREVKETIKLLKNHPSICSWVIFNEGWGQFDAPKATALIRALDNTRFINEACGWFDQRGGDMYSIHNYSAGLDVEAKEDRVVALTEFGGYSYAVPGHLSCEKEFGYQSFTSREELTAHYCELWKTRFIRIW